MHYMHQLLMQHMDLNANATPRQHSTKDLATEMRKEERSNMNRRDHLHAGTTSLENLRGLATPAVNACCTNSVGAAQKNFRHADFEGHDADKLHYLNADFRKTAPLR